MKAAKKIDAVLDKNIHLFQTEEQRERVRGVLIECVETGYTPNDFDLIEETMNEQINLMVFNGDYARLGC